MTQQEITALRNQVWEDHLNGDATEPCTIKRLDLALERLEKLEAAVAWHGFDEVPEGDHDNPMFEVELTHRDGRVMKKWFFIDDSSFCERDGEGIDVDFYVGWRYPIGDLG